MSELLRNCEHRGLSQVSVLVNLRGHSGFCVEALDEITDTVISALLGNLRDGVIVGGKQRFCVADPDSFQIRNRRNTKCFLELSAQIGVADAQGFSELCNAKIRRGEGLIDETLSLGYFGGNQGVISCFAYALNLCQDLIKGCHTGEIQKIADSVIVKKFPKHAPKGSVFCRQNMRDGNSGIFCQCEMNGGHFHFFENFGAVGKALGRKGNMIRAGQ